jgi:hypothetical protein
LGFSIQLPEFFFFSEIAPKLVIDSIIGTAMLENSGIDGHSLLTIQ